MSLEAERGLPLQTHEAVETARGAYRRLAGNGGFRRLWVAQFVSGVGDWLVIGFLMPLVTALSGGSALAVAGILIAKIVPALFLSSFIGALVDRFDRRKTMIVADLVRAVLTLALFFTNNLAAIYLVVFLMEIASLFFFPSRSALIPRLVKQEDVPAAQGLAYATQQGSMIIGLAASGAVLAGFESIVRGVIAADLPIVASLVGLFAPALLGPRAGVFINSLTFLLSAALIVGIKGDARVQRTAERLNFRLIGRDVLESFHFLRAHRELRGFMVTVGLAILGGGTIVPVGLVHVQRNLSRDGFGPLGEVQFLETLVAAPQTFMLLFLATGMLAGGLWVPKLAARLSLQRLLLAGVVGFGVAMAVFSLVTTFALAGLCAAVAGACIAAVTVAGNTYVIRNVADEIRGRVFTALESLVRVALLLSMVVMAPLGDLVARLAEVASRFLALGPALPLPTGSQLSLQIAALVVLASAVYAFRTLDWRSRDESIPDA